MQRLSDIIDQDNAAIMNDFRDFTETLTISTNSANERQVMGSLQSDEIAFTAGSGSPLNAYNCKLYLIEQADLNLSKNCVLYVNRRAYKITDSRLEMGVRELSLEAKR